MAQIRLNHPFPFLAIQNLNIYKSLLSVNIVLCFTVFFTEKCLHDGALYPIGEPVFLPERLNMADKVCDDKFTEKCEVVPVECDYRWWEK